MSNDSKKKNPKPTDNSKSNIRHNQSSKNQADVKIEELTRQVADLTQALQRERADATNIRRHHQEQVASLQITVKAQVVEDLLPVIDNLDRALKHVPKELETNAYVAGVQSIVRQFESILSQMGVERIKTSGESFDPNLHEAVSVEGEGDTETVSEEIQAGYRLGDHIIRHAMVKIRRA